MDLRIKDMGDKGQIIESLATNVFNLCSHVWMYSGYFAARDRIEASIFSQLKEAASNLVGDLLLAAEITAKRQGNYGEIDGNEYANRLTALYESFDSIVFESAYKGCTPITLNSEALTRSPTDSFSVNYSLLFAPVDLRAPNVEFLSRRPIIDLIIEKVAEFRRVDPDLLRKVAQENISFLNQPVIRPSGFKMKAFFTLRPRPDLIADVASDGYDIMVMATKFDEDTLNQTMIEVAAKNGMLLQILGFNNVLGVYCPELSFPLSELIK